MSVDLDWKQISREWVEPWEGCRLLTDDGDSITYQGGLISYTGWQPDEVIVDLTHPPTAREAVARLALFLGAPERVVDEGVGFYHDGCGWELQSTRHDYEEAEWGCFAYLAKDVPADNRALAIALAWKEARERKESSPRIDWPCFNWPGWTQVPHDRFDSVRVSHESGLTTSVSAHVVKECHPAAAEAVGKAVNDAIREGVTGEVYIEVTRHNEYEYSARCVKFGAET